MYRTTTSVTVLLTLALGSVATTPALAQPATVDKEKAKTAKQYVDAGLAAQNAKDYDTAITLYQKAYDLVPHPVLLFNIAQAHRLAGRTDVAVGFYERYLAADAKGAQARTARALLDEIAAKQAADAKKIQDAKKAEETRKADDARKVEDARKAEAARKAQPEDKAPELETQPEIPETPVSESARPGRSLRIAGIAAAGAGAVAFGASIAFALRSGSISDELSMPGAPYDPGRIRDGEAAERNAIIAGVVGGALVAGGVALYVLGVKKRNAQTEQMAISVRSDFVGVTFGGVLP